MGVECPECEGPMSEFSEGDAIHYVCRDCGYRNEKPWLKESTDEKNPNRGGE